MTGEHAKERDRGKLHIQAGPCCNNNCLFCMENRGCSGEKAGELQKNFGKILEENKRLDSVIFTHHEPTLNPKLADYISLAKKAGYGEIVLVTNGRMLSYSNFARKIAKAGLTCVTVSIHGPNAEVHDRLTRCSGSFAQTFRGLANALELKKEFPLRVTTNTVVVRQNLQHMGEMIKILSSLDVDHIQFLSMKLEGRNLRNFREVCPAYSDAGKAFCGAMRQAESAGIDINKVGLCAPFCTVEAAYRKNITYSENAPMLSDRRKCIKMSGLGRIKADKCRDCSYFDSCDGVQEYYAQKTGFREFSPIKLQEVQGNEKRNY